MRTTTTETSGLLGCCLFGCLGGGLFCCSPVVDDLRILDVVIAKAWHGDGSNLSGHRFGFASISSFEWHVDSECRRISHVDAGGIKGRHVDSDRWDFTSW